MLEFVGVFAPEDFICNNFELQLGFTFEANEYIFILEQVMAHMYL